MSSHYAIIEACEPDALPASTEAVSWFVMPDSEKDPHRSSGCPLVQITGTREAILVFLREYWGITDAEDASSYIHTDGMPTVGDRVRLIHEVWRYPHFKAAKGSTGTVVDTGDPSLYAVRMDDKIHGAEDWNNEIHWFNDDDPAEDIERV